MNSKNYRQLIRACRLEKERQTRTEHEQRLDELYQGLCGIARTFGNGFTTWPVDQPDLHDACVELEIKGLLRSSGSGYDGKAFFWEVVV